MARHGVRPHLGFVAAASVLAVLVLASPVAADPDEAALPHLAGAWVIEELRSGGHYPVTLTQQDRTVVASYGAIVAEPERGVHEGVELFDVRLSEDGRSLSGEITVRGASETHGPVSRSVPLALTLDEATGIWSGHHQNMRWREGATPPWQEAGEWPIRLVPACRNIQGPIRLGTGRFRVEIELSEILKPIPPVNDPRAREGYCHYAAQGAASMSIQTGDQQRASGLFAQSVAVTGLDIEVYTHTGRDPAEPSAYHEVRLTWSDDGTRMFQLFEIEGLGLEFYLYSIGITFVIGPQGELGFGEAFIEALLNVEHEIRVAGPVFLGGDLASIIRYDWNAGGNRWTDGAWSFDGLAGIELQLRREGTMPIALLRLEVDEQGVARGTLMLTPMRTWTAYGYEITLTECTLRAEVHLRQGTFRFLDGTIRGRVRTPAPTETTLDLSLSYDGDFIRASVGADRFRLFGGWCEDAQIDVVLDTNRLSFTSIEGTLRWSHDRFTGNRLEIRQVRFENGVLTRFAGAGAIEFRGFSFSVLSLDFDATDEPAVLRVSASLDIAWSNVSVQSELRNFTIDTHGAISEFELHVDVSTAAASATLEAAFVDRPDRVELRGSFRGSIAGTVGIAGEAVLGRQRAATPIDGFAYASLEFSVEFARGVPLANTGLSVFGIGGGFGFNYVPRDAPSEIGEAGPRHNQHYLSASVTLGDAARLIELTGRMRLLVGRSTALQITGTLRITGRTPYFDGTLDVSHVLFSGRVDGSLTTSVKVPASGSIVNIERNRVDFGISTTPRSQFTLRGSNLGGRFFGALDVSGGSIFLSSSLSNPIADLTGELTCRLSASVSQSVSRRLAGFSVHGSVRITVDGQARVQLNERGMRGSFRISAQAAGRISLSTPAVTVRGYEVISSRRWTEHVSARATLACRQSNDGRFLRCTGEFSVRTSLGSASFAITYDF